MTVSDKSKLARRFGGAAIAGTAAVMLAAAPVQAQDIKLGFLGGITGPIAAPAVHIVNAAQLAIKHVNDQGGLNGRKFVMPLADTKCDSQNAVAAANKLVNIDQVAGISGALCSGATIAAANAVTIKAGVTMISPSATSPAITDLKDGDTLFRVAPSDGFQGVVLAKALLERGIKKVAVTYANTDYAKPLGQAFIKAFKAGGGTLTEQIHEDKKSSYRSELATLRRGGADTLVVVGYPQGSAGVILRQALEGGLFKRFAGPEAIFDEKMWSQLGVKNLEGLMYTKPATSRSLGAERYAQAMKAYKPKSYGQLFTAQTYDATFITAMALARTGGKREGMPAAIRSVTKAGGVTVYPAEWKKAMAAIREGKDINYVGASGTIRFDANGDIGPKYDFFVLKGGKPQVLKTY